MGEVFEPTMWVPLTPERELFGIYGSTIKKRFPAFGIRDVRDAAADIMDPFLPHDPSEFIDDELLSIILTQESFDAYCQSLRRHIERHKLDSRRDIGTLIFATDHGQFTDVPVTAEALARIEFVERPRLTQVIGLMIATMELDLGKGSFAVTSKLRGISNLLSTVPRLDGTPSKELEDYRERRNAQSTATGTAILKTAGSTLVMSAIGRHNATSKSGKTLFIHEPNQRTFDLMDGDDIWVVPTYVHCPTFRPDGRIIPANLTSELLPPIRIQDVGGPRKAAHFVTEQFRNATQRSVGNHYPNGVKIRRWAAQQTVKRIERGMQRLRGKEPETSTDY
jgi:hypothetical protein